MNDINFRIIVSDKLYRKKWYIHNALERGTIVLKFHFDSKNSLDSTLWIHEPASMNNSLPTDFMLDTLSRVMKVI